ncbi:MAG: 3-phosphoshikimate 1-carboxyvinyltransferase [Oscillospiraceae bacterium]|nr:3-phosphoshikimate 1-carboxyvinyltransferase [Oscillospiraceae bacterium]
MTLTLKPGRLSGEIAAMPSKYELHRLMIAAHLAGMGLESLPVISDDIEATRECLAASHPPPFGLPPLAEGGLTDPCLRLNCRESGSTLRFLLPVFAALGKSVTFTGTGRLPARPMQPLVDLLRAHGCSIDSERLPIAISGQLRPGIFALPGDITSQYVTGLLFALPLLIGESEIILTSPLESAGYVQMTLRTLRKFGIVIHETEQGFAVPGGQKYQLSTVNCQLSIEADWSSAAFWLAANALGSDIRITGLDGASEQSDRAITSLLEHRGVMDASQYTDLAPIMAVVMALTPGEGRIANAARLRLKESDRLHAIAENLNALGGDVTELPDGLVIQGKPTLQGGGADSFGDHRIAMAMAVAALRCENPITLHGAQAVQKSYPAFWEDYQRLGGKIA